MESLFAIAVMSIPPIVIFIGALLYNLEKWSYTVAVEQRSYISDRLGNRLVSFYPVSSDKHAKYLITFRNPWILYRNIKIKSQYYD